MIPDVHGTAIGHDGRTISGGAYDVSEADTVIWHFPKRETGMECENSDTSPEVPTVSNNPKDIAALSKVPLQLIPPSAERLVAHVLADGAAKYGPWNWRDKGIGLMTYIGAIQRHANAIRDGQDIDPESGRPHVAHIAATAMILMDAAEHSNVIDDRPHGTRRAKP